LILNNLFLATGLGAVLIGTLYPLLLDAIAGKTISVGAPFFNLTFGTLMAPLLVLIPFGPFLAWKRGDLVAVVQRLAGALVVTLLATLGVFIATGAQVSLAPLGLLLGFWVGFGAIAEIVDRIKLGRIAPIESWNRLKGLPRTAFSTALAHFGMGFTVIGIVATSAWPGELITTMSPGQTAKLSGYSVLFNGTTDAGGPNYDAQRASFTITDPSGGVRQSAAERRTFTASHQQTTEADIQTYGLSQLYLQLGEAGDGNTSVVRLWYKPYVTMIWLGAVIMALGGFLSLTDRRLRVGAPKRKARQPVAEPAE
jgi:cytochrome c-type biogenesis protein CcmF